MSIFTKGIKKSEIEQKNSLYVWFIYILLFLTALNFINRFYFLAFILFIFVVTRKMLKNEEVKVNFNLAILFFFSISYTMISFLYTEISVNGLIKNLLYPFLYFIGKDIVEYDNEKKEFYVENILFTIILGTYFHGLLNLNLLIKNQSFIFSSRQFPDIWMGGDLLSATLLSTMFTISIGSGFYGIFILKMKKNIIKKIIIISSVVVAFIYNMITASRTIYLLFIVSFLFCLIYRISTLEKFNVKTFKAIKSFSIVVVIGLLLYNINIFSIKTFIQMSPLLNRIEYNKVSGENVDPRFVAYENVFWQFFDHPLGGRKMYLGGLEYAHNFWLDVLNATGHIPFILLIIFTISVIVNFLRLIKSKIIHEELKILIIGIFSVMLFQFMSEPILEGVPWLFALFCLICGMNDKLLIKRSKKQV